jgi:hypothetical protein
VHHAQHRHKVALCGIEDAIGKDREKRTSNAASSLGIETGRLRNHLELGLQGFKEIVAKTRNLLLIPIVGLADLADRTVGDG